MDSSRQIKRAVSRTLSRAAGRPLPMKEYLNRNDIMDGLNTLSNRIYSGALGPLTIVVSGGACSVLHPTFGARQTTKDVNFFADGEVIRKITSARTAAERELVDFPRSWINANMVAYVVNNKGCEGLFDASVKGNMVLYSSPSLRVYAADLRYQFVGKVKQAYDELQYCLPQDMGRRSIAGAHLLDAVHILRFLVDNNNSGRSIKLSLIKTWYYFGSFITVTQAGYLNLLYRNTFPGTWDAIDAKS